MAIAYQGTDFNIAFATTTVSKSITTSGSDVTLVVMGATNGGAVTNTPTFNGTNFTQVGSAFTIPSGPGAGNILQTWVLPSAFIGTATLTLTQSATSLIAFSVTWYSGTDASQPDNFTAHTSGTGTAFTPTVTTAFNNSWIIAMGQQAGTLSAGASTIDRQQNIGYTFDSNGARSIGSNSLNLNVTPSNLLTYITLGLKEKNATGAFTPTPLIHMMQITGGNM